MTPIGVADALAICAERLGPAADAVVARLASSPSEAGRRGDHTLGDAVRAALAELANLDPAARKQRRAEIATASRAPVPAGLRAVHGSWIEAALADLPARTRTALASPVGDPVDVWLARWATAGLPPMTVLPRSPWSPILAREPAAIIDWLTAIGADQLAFALGSSAVAHPRLAAAAARIARAPRLGQLGPQRAAIARCRGVSLAGPVDEARRAVLVVASRALAPHLAIDPLARLQLARRLPHRDGKLVEDELLAHAGLPLDQCPSWAALISE